MRHTAFSDPSHLDMSNDPLGPEPLFGDGARTPEHAGAEDFLGLGDSEAGAAFELEEDESLTLPAPADEDFADLDRPDSVVGTELEPLEGLTPPEFDREQVQDRLPLESVELDDEDEFEADDALAFLDDGDETALVQLESRVPSAEEYIEQVSPLAPEPWEESFESADTFKLELEGQPESELEVEEYSWLMEFELEEDMEFAEPVTLISRHPQAEYGEDGELVGAGAGSSSLLPRALLVAASVALGVVGSRFLPFGRPAPQVATQVAQAPAQPLEPTPPTPPAAESTPVVEESPVEVVQIAPQPDAPAVGPLPEVLIEPEVVIEVPQIVPGLERRTQELQVEDMVLLAEESNEHVRQATAQEMAGIWLGATIPLNAMTVATRLLTPNVGRVRVLLTGGEVFEGELYAIGEKKVWLQTELGRMALLEWQIDRIEHILTNTGSAVLGGDGSQDLAGLKSVRVRTAGGVFYGKLLSQEAGDVTLLTRSGARVTLAGAEVEMAGRSTTRLIDASGAIEDDPAGEPLE
jgi:hypothetical protein